MDRSLGSLPCPHPRTILAVVTMVAAGVAVEVGAVAVRIWVGSGSAPYPWGLWATGMEAVAERERGTQ